MNGNPFLILEFTPALVRIFQKTPGLLLKLAETHRRWLLSVYHPDRQEGNLEVAKRITAAFDVLKDANRREKAIEEFLSTTDSERNFIAMELQQSRRDLQEEQRKRREEKRKSNAQDDYLDDTLARNTTALASWIANATLPEDQMELRHGEKTEFVSLAGTVLVTAAPASPYAQGILVGPRRRVHRRDELSRGRIARYLKNNRKGSVTVRFESFLFGSFHGKTKIGNFEFPNEKEKLIELTSYLQPYLEIGKPVAILEQRKSSRWISVTPPLQEIRRGSFRIFDCMEWFPQK